MKETTYGGKKYSADIIPLVSRDLAKFEDSLSTKEKAIEKFRKDAAVDIARALLKTSTLQAIKKGRVRLIGWGDFNFPREVTNQLELITYLIRSASTKPDVDWLFKQFDRFSDGTHLNDLRPGTKQRPSDIMENKWFFSVFEKLRLIGGDSMSCQQLCVLSLIAKSGNDGITTNGITEVLKTKQGENTSLSSVQRQLGRLGEGYKFKIPSGEEKTRDGLKLIEEFVDPVNRKQNRFVLSVKGAKFFKQLNDVSHRR